MKLTRKGVVIGVLSIVLIFALVSGSNLALYINFLIGNDIIISLDANKVHLDLVRPKAASITFDASVTTNPFCQASCASTFSALGNNTILASDTFDLSPGKTFSATYDIAPMQEGEGISLYRFAMECASKSNWLCHSNNEPTQRTILITATSRRSSVEELLRNDANLTVHEYKQRLSSLKSQFLASQAALSLADDIIDVSLIAKDLGFIRISERELAIGVMQTLWKKESYYELRDFVDFQLRELTIDEAKGSKTFSEIQMIFENFNTLSLELAEIRGQLPSSIPFGDLDLLNESIEHAYNTLTSRSSIVEKQNAIRSLNQTVTQFVFEIEKSISHQITQSIIVQAVIINASCVNCQEHFDFSAEEVCMSARTFENFSLPNNSQVVDWANDYSDAAPQVISMRIRDALNFSLGIKNALLAVCDQGPIRNFREDSPLSMFIPAAPQIEFDAEFSLQPKICCVLGSCHACCSEPTCNNNPATYPILFIHGHAFNQGTSYDQSLDSFNALQKQLENDGYAIKAGAISIYSPRDIPQGTWGVIGKPVSIKGSYYFDLFKQQDDYVIVQTKSENIDTYAIRMRDIINTVKYKTGKDKVIIISHSMGGLVTRRYAQLFGDDALAGVVFIGSPQKGISTSIGRYCRILGHNQECRDMEEGSLLLNKLDQDLIGVPSLNVIGIGCSMNGGDGDGVVLTSNAKLVGSKELEVRGTCTGTTLLHNSLLNIAKYPVVYSAITNFLDGINSTLLK